jgi:hypothetical protein
VSAPECKRCGEDIVAGQCVQCRDDVFCAHCDVEVATEACDQARCGKQVCGEHSVTSGYGTPDEYTVCQCCIDADEDAAERMGDEMRDERGWQS